MMHNLIHHRIRVVISQSIGTPITSPTRIRYLTLGNTSSRLNRLIRRTRFRIYLRHKIIRGHLNSRNRHWVTTISNRSHTLNGIRTKLTTTRLTIINSIIISRHTQLGILSNYHNTTNTLGTTTCHNNNRRTSRQTITLTNVNHGYQRQNVRMALSVNKDYLSIGRHNRVIIGLIGILNWGTNGQAKRKFSRSFLNYAITLYELRVTALKHQTQQLGAVRSYNHGHNGKLN